MLKFTLSVRINLFYLYFPPSFHPTVLCFCPVGLSLLTTFSTGLVGVKNIVLTTKVLQDRNIKLLGGTTVENKGKTNYF